jgi:hypothetical protein
VAASKAGDATRQAPVAGAAVPLSLHPTLAALSRVLLVPWAGEVRTADVHMNGVLGLITGVTVRAAAL